MVKTNFLRNADDFETFTPGQVIFREGEAGDKMYVIQEGQIGLSIGTLTLETLEEGEMFGEMALIDQKGRTATATALTECKLVPVDEKRFSFMCHQTPYFALQVMQTMAERLRKTNDRVVAKETAPADESHS